MQLTPLEIAEVCHEANRALQRIQAEHTDTGVPVAAPWPDETNEQRESVAMGVVGVLAGLTPAESHEAWCKHKRAHGWTHGPVKDEAARTHPCLVPYDELPPEQQIKDDLFCAIVDALGDTEPRPLDVEGRHPGVAAVARFFRFDHLPANLAPVAMACHELARIMVDNLDDSPQLTIGLQKLLEAKDAFVRAAL